MELGIIDCLALVGALVILFFLLTSTYTLIHGILIHFQPNQVPFTTRFGKWAVVTGCTDGIGRAYAFELAKRGLYVVLISRSQDKLEKLAEEIEALHLVETKIITVDFCDVTEALKKIEAEIKDIPVGILVNNVGKQYDYPMYLCEVPDEALWDIINVNIGATTLMTRLILPQMVERRKGAIVNVSSGSEVQPLPLMTVYAATKTYIKSFSAALRIEYSKYGITIQHLSPLFINTKMNEFSKSLRSPKSGLIVPDAKVYAAAAINTLGRVDQTTGFWAHGVQAFVFSYLPVPFLSHMGRLFNQYFRTEYFNKLKEKTN